MRVPSLRVVRPPAEKMPPPKVRALLFDMVERASVVDPIREYNAPPYCALQREKLELLQEEVQEDII